MTTPFLRFEIDAEALTDAMWDFVRDPKPSRNERPVVQALSDLHPESVDIMESMLLDGTEDRADVAAYVSAVFGSGGSPTSGPIGEGIRHPLGGG